MNKEKKKAFNLKRNKVRRSPECFKKNKIKSYMFSITGLSLKRFKKYIIKFSLILIISFADVI